MGFGFRVLNEGADDEVLAYIRSSYRGSGSGFRVSGSEFRAWFRFSGRCIFAGLKATQDLSWNHLKKACCKDLQKASQLICWSRFLADGQISRIRAFRFEIRQNLGMEICRMPLTSIYGLFICTCYWTVVHGLEGGVKYSMSVQTTRYWPSSCRKTSVYDTMFSCFNLCRTFACHRSFRRWVR